LQLVAWQQKGPDNRAFSLAQNGKWYRIGTGEALSPQNLVNRGGGTVVRVAE
jgi:hypothetical protein